ISMHDARHERGTPAGEDQGRILWRRVFTGLRVLGHALVLAGFAIAYLAGLLFNLLFLFAIFMAAATLMARLVGIVPGPLEFGLLKHPLSRQTWPYLLQCLNRWMFWGMTAVTLVLSIVPIQFSAAEYFKIWALIGAALVTLALSQLVPPRRIRVLGNLLYAIG